MFWGLSVKGGSAAHELCMQVLEVRRRSPVREKAQGGHGLPSLRSQWLWGHPDKSDHQDNGIVGQAGSCPHGFQELFHLHIIFH